MWYYILVKFVNIFIEWKSRMTHADPNCPCRTLKLKDLIIILLLAGVVAFVSHGMLEVVKLLLTGSFVPLVKQVTVKKFSLVWFAVKVNYIQLISVLQMMSFLQRKVTASVVSAALPIVLCTAFCFRNKKRQTRHCLTVTVLILFPFVSGSVLLGLVRGEKCCIYELCLKHSSAVLKYIKSPRKYLNIKMQEVIDKDPSIFLLK